MSTIAKQESIETLSEEFDRKVGSIAMSVHKQEHTDDDKDREEPLYSQRVLQRLEKDSSSMVASSQIVMTELKSQLDKLNGKDSAQVESMLSVMEP